MSTLETILGNLFPALVLIGLISPLVALFGNAWMLRSPICRTRSHGTKKIGSC
jgi:hypothetical protein